MTTFGLILLIIILFYFLGRAADVVVANLKLIAGRLGLDISFLGFMLGFFTSFPELSIAINASLTGYPGIAVGNLLGGIPVLLGLVLGLNVLLNRRISTRITQRPIAFIAGMLCLPLLLAIDGQLNDFDGMILILAYASTVVALYLQGHHARGPVLRLFWHRDSTRPLAMIVSASVIVALLANLIVRFTEELLVVFQIPAFAVGLLVFSIGSNLPEIIISIRAYKKHQEELSISNIIGSSMANIIILGLMAVIAPLSMTIGIPFWFMFVVYVLILGTVVATYRTGGRFTRGEGVALLVGYLVFVFSQVIVRLIDRL